MFSSNSGVSEIPCDMGDTGMWRHKTPPAFAHPPAYGMPVRETAGSRGGLLTQVLNELDYGLMVVSDTARIRLANQAALRECRPAQCMQIHDGHVQPRDERDRGSFVRALTASRLGRRSMLSLHSIHALVSVAVVPMGEVVEAGGTWTALLAFGRRQACEPISLEFFAREHGLTGAEGQVLKGLCGGLRPVQIARDAGVALSTVRTQVSSIRLKTEAKSIGELVRRLTMLPPIVPALDKVHWALDGFSHARGG
jgi:DNA-binding CsgD family transcriptional regulator